MKDDVILRRDTVAVRRQVMDPGEATPWHVDPHDRISVVLRGDELRIEFKDGGDPIQVTVHPGEVDWDEPGERAHRAVNTGDSTYEEVTVFLLGEAAATLQPGA